MMLKIYNTLSKKKELFEALKVGELSMYVCGPTVYDIPHLGHGRSAVSFDVIRKYFEYKGYNVKFVSNYTDIDDKMINRAAVGGISVSELADKVIPEYEKDYAALSVKKPTVQPKATEHIVDMVEIIKKLDDGGFVYVLDDGVYFDVSKFKDYGKLSGQNLEDLRMGSRVDVKLDKVNPYDFAVWKFKKDGEPFWESPWGEGRPGWHIECSAMSFKHLGKTFDIHGGGLDLIFPHHECELAQSESVFGEYSFARHWIHNGFINVDNEKMSKSLGNFSTLRDIFESYDPKVVRFMFLQTHYRNPINFSFDLLDQAKSALGRLHDFVRRLKAYSESGDGFIGLSDLLGESKLAFESFMDNDFDCSGALGVVFDLLNVVNKALDDKKLNISDLSSVLSLLGEFDSVLGIIFPVDDDLELDFLALIKEREEARLNKDFKRSDEIRDELKGLGILLEDVAGATIWKRI